MTAPTRRDLLASGLGFSLALSGRSAASGRLQEPADADLGRTPHTRFAANVEIWWGKLPFLDRIRKAAALGFPAVEFWGLQGKDLDGVGSLARELGIEVAQFTAWGFEPGMNDPRNHPAFLEAVKRGCAAARKLAAKAMCVVGGNDQPGTTQPEMHRQIVAGLRLAAPIAEEAGVTLLLEPMNVRVDHKGHCLYGSEPAVRICREVASPRVKILWDLYHMQISEGDLCGRLREGFDQLGYVQVADHPGPHEPGTGEVHYPRVLRELHDLGYRGFVGLECWPSAGELEAARAAARADRW